MYAKRPQGLGQVGETIVGVQTLCPEVGVCYEVPIMAPGPSEYSAPPPRTIVGSEVSRDGRSITYIFSDGSRETTHVNDQKYLDMIAAQEEGGASGPNRDPYAGPVELGLEYTTAGAGAGLGLGTILILAGLVYASTVRPRVGRR